MLRARILVPREGWDTQYKTSLRCSSEPEFSRRKFLNFFHLICERIVRYSSTIGDKNVITAQIREKILYHMQR